MEYEYDYSPDFGGLSKIEGAATNTTDRVQTIVLGVGCDGKESTEIRLPDVAPDATARFSEFAFCDSPSASIVRAEYE